MFRSGLRYKPQWNTRAYSYDPLLLYLFATLMTFVACLAQVLIVSLSGQGYTYLLFFVAIVASAWIGGFSTGVYSTLLSACIAYAFFIPPLYTVTLKDPSYLIGSFIFFLEGVFISYLSQNMHTALKNSILKNTELIRSEERYRSVVESVKDYAIYTLDKEGYITSWNRGSEHTKGYTLEEVLKKHYSLFFEPTEISEGIPWKYLALATENGRYEFEGWRSKKDGTKFWANSIITPIIDDSKTVCGFSVISRDLTERKEIERRKDDFISIASHELRTPVTSVKVFTQVLLKIFSRHSDKSPVKYLMKMDAQMDKLTLLINDLLDVSRIQSGKLEFKQEVLNLQEIANEVVENMQTLSDRHTIVCTGSVYDYVLADKDRIGQVLINLISNAIKYSPNADTVDVALTQNESEVIVSVRDYGVGIPEDYKEKIFERFFRVYDDREKTYPGLGMGLYISAEIVKRHNGRIWVESELGKGSIFYMSIPVSAQNQAATAFKNDINETLYAPGVQP